MKLRDELVKMFDDMDARHQGELIDIARMYRAKGAKARAESGPLASSVAVPRLRLVRGGGATSQPVREPVHCAVS